MAAYSQGGKRLGAGCLKVADVLLTAGVSSAASKTIKVHCMDDGIVGGGFCHMADFPATVRAQLPSGSEV